MFRLSCEIVIYLRLNSFDFTAAYFEVLRVLIDISILISILIISFIISHFKLTVIDSTITVVDFKLTVIDCIFTVTYMLIELIPYFLYMLII